MLWAQLVATFARIPNWLSRLPARATDRGQRDQTLAKERRGSRKAVFQPCGFLGRAFGSLRAFDMPKDGIADITTG